MWVCVIWFYNMREKDLFQSMCIVDYALGTFCEVLGILFRVICNLSSKEANY